MKKTLEIFVAVAALAIGAVLWRQWRASRDAAAAAADRRSPADIPAAVDVDPRHPNPPPERGKPHPHSVTGLPMIRLVTPPKKQRPPAAVPSPGR